MAVQTSTMTDLGTEAPDFDLPIANPGVDDLDAPTRKRADYAGAEALVVVFTCNHCPYAVHVQEALVRTALDYQKRGVAFVAICSNDPDRYPSDGFDAMADRARELRFPFPYLHDATQAVAAAYQAVCTPDFFVYDVDRRLAYRGRFDATRPNQGQAATGSDLRAALDALLAGSDAPEEQFPSMGCNIKWKPGNEPDYV